MLSGNPECTIAELVWLLHRRVGKRKEGREGRMEGLGKVEWAVHTDGESRVSTLVITSEGTPKCIIVTLRNDERNLLLSSLDQEQAQI